MTNSQETVAQEKKRLEEEERARHEARLPRLKFRAQRNRAFGQVLSISASGEAPPATPLKSGGRKPSGLSGSPTISPTTSSTTSPTTANSGYTSLAISERRVMRPPGLTRPRYQWTSSASVDAVAAERVPTLRRLPPVSNAPMTKPSTGAGPSRIISLRTPIMTSSSSGPSDTTVKSPVTSTEPNKTTDNLLKKTNPVDDGFELMGNGELDEDFDEVSGDGPSASNGRTQPDPDVVMDKLDGAFRSQSKGRQAWDDEE